MDSAIICEAGRLSFESAVSLEKQKVNDRGLVILVSKNV